MQAMSAVGTRRYKGLTTVTSCPRVSKAPGRADATSPSPPVFENGATSAETNSTRIALIVSRVNPG